MNKILVVEDNEKNLKLVRALLVSHGYEIIEATDGETGVALAREHKPRLILMDIRMPVMDGINAIKVLKEIPETRDIPVIALTAYAMRGDREKLLSEGFAEYVTKPINVRTFPAIIKKFF